MLRFAPEPRFRDEYVLAASSITEFLGEDASKIAAIRINGLTVKDATAGAAALKAKYAADLASATEGKKSWDERLLKSASTAIATRGEAKVEKFLKRFRAESAIQRPPRVSEAVYERAEIEIDLADGQHFVFHRVPILLRDPSLRILRMSALTTSAMAAVPFPCTGSIPALVGAVSSFVNGVRAYCSAELREGHAWLLNAGKYVVLGAIDLIPIVATGAIFVTALNIFPALHHLQAGDTPVLNLKYMMPLLEGVRAAQQDDAAPVLRVA